MGGGIIPLMLGCMEGAAFGAGDAVVPISFLTGTAGTAEGVEIDCLTAP